MARTNRHQENSVQQYVKLEDRLVLLAWLNSLLGYQSNKQLLEDTKDVSEGFGPDGRSFLYYHLIARGSKLKLNPEDLARYDQNIRAHLATINSRRTEPVTLRYFQYLAALYTEIFLDRYFGHRAQLLADLNAFVLKRNAQKSPGEAQDASFTEDDLKKSAYWMATGSGKTLILHLNYYQFLHYNSNKSNKPLDNILLITPNEGLSEQHLAELAASGIAARRFDPDAPSAWTENREMIKVIEITKLTKEKRGEGVSVPVEAFEGRNLIFVDEGHKGAGGEAWRNYRDALGKDGFTFEYSATFGQALSAARDDALTAEYGKCIIFDYSYRYFYGDGYGKDFRILNLSDEAHQKHTDLLLLGNLLSFYEQLRLYETRRAELQPYNLEKPLWVFVGSTVNAVYSENKTKRSDVLTVVRFMHNVLQDRGWAEAGIKSLLEGKTGLVSPDGMDVFAGRFQFLQDLSEPPSAIYDDFLSRLFHARSAGGLRLCTIRSSQGELGLKAAGADRYFGVIYIGDTAAFRKLVEADKSEVTLEEDAISGSLFEEINRPDSRIHVLIGARKFIEGWSSWRVSNMGLLNIGRQEGAQIIQLFGRGVRLKGKGLSLKRSSALPGAHPAHVRLLETLNIFAVRANYMALFRNYLEREGVETEAPVELPIFAQIDQQLPQHELVVPRADQARDFVKEKTLLLEVDQKIQDVLVNLSSRVQTVESSATGLHQTQVRAGSKGRIPSQMLDCVDWAQVYLDLLAYKQRQGLANLVIRSETLRQVLEGIQYRLIADDEVIHPRVFIDLDRLQEAATTILRSYVDKFYRTRQEAWEASERLVYRLLDKDDPNLSFNAGVAAGHPGPTYIAKVQRSEERLVTAIQQLIQAQNGLYKHENASLPRINFKRHLYIPLLLEQVDKVQFVPPALNENEAKFVRDLRDYWNAEKDNALKDKAIFLLRNLSRGKGIAFFEGRGFYPDFILWIIDQGTKHQRIVFVEPHGMLSAKSYIHDEKARLHERLPALAQEIAARSEHKNVSLDSYIISATEFKDLRKRYDDGKWDRARFAQHHILFLERNQQYDYIQILLQCTSTTLSSS